jgi:hypothetical protein
MIATRLVLRSRLLKTGQRSRPHFNALEIGMDPIERFDQIADDEIFRRVGYRYDGLLACHVLPFVSTRASARHCSAHFRRGEIPKSHAGWNSF